MTDNAKKALEFIKNNNDAMEKFKTVKSIDEVLNLAKEYGFNLTEEDLNITQEKKEMIEGKKKLDIDELEKVSGAGQVCVCVIGGGGKGVSTADNKSFDCVCVVGGAGGTSAGANCACFVGGTGDTRLTDGCYSYC